MANDYFPCKEMLCTKTIYNYIDKGLMKIRNHHLPEKISRNLSVNKYAKAKENSADLLRSNPT